MNPVFDNMNPVFEAIKSLSKNGYAVVNNESLNEVTEMLQGLGVRYSVVKVSATVSSLVKE